MAANTADRLQVSRALETAFEDEFPIATNATVYAGNMVNFDVNGRLVDATAAASRRFAGICTAILNDSGAVVSAGTGNASSTVKARVQNNYQELLDVKTAARTFTNLGKEVYVSDNHTVDGTAAGTALARVAVGQLMSFNSPTDKTKAWIWLRTASPDNAAAAG